MDWLERYRTAEFTGIAGFLITLVGFGVTVLNVIRAREASEQARDAAERAREEVRRSQTTIALSQVVVRMEELKRFHREGMWQALPDRYSQLRRDLVSIRHRSPYLTASQATRLQEGIMLLAKLEERLDRQPAKTTPDGVARTNRLVSEQMANLLQLLHELEDHGNAAR